jgi:4-alpha-glucanotransferase
MGLHRAWWVPHGAGATHGAYVMQPSDELFAIVCIESVRAGTGIIAENLGTVPPEIRTELDEHDLMGMAMAGDGVSLPRPNDLVALSSHDTPSFPAWWNGNDVEDLLDLDVFDDERARAERSERWSAIRRLQEQFGTDGVVATRDALLTWMASTPAAVALVNIAEERRQNIPGTDWERPNWRLRHATTIEQMAADPVLGHLLDRFVAARTGPGA